jgi:hypothetical protein
MISVAPKISAAVLAQAESLGLCWLLAGFLKHSSILKMEAIPSCELEEAYTASYPLHKPGMSRPAVGPGGVFSGYRVAGA